MYTRARLTALITLLALFWPFFPEANPIVSDSKIIVTDADKAILQAKLDKFAAQRSLPIGELIINIGKDFMGTPYVAKTLDKTNEENLVVNLRELDCTTFVENCLAIARTVKSSKPNFKQFITELEKIRYRNGKMDGYVSRLHYFSEWISNNESKRLLDDVTFQLGGIRMPINLNLMSTKPEAYPQLKSNDKLIEQVKIIETELSARIFFYIPTAKFGDAEADIQDGDIAAMTSPIEGIDVLHVGLMFRNQNRIYFLHASSTQKKVVITEEPFEQYLSESKRSSGIMIARPL